MYKVDSFPLYKSAFIRIYSKRTDTYYRFGTRSNNLIDVLKCAFKVFVYETKNKFLIIKKHKVNEMKYINQSAIRKLAKSFDKRTGKDFLFHLDLMVEQTVKKACAVHNGGKKTLDASIAEFVFYGDK